MFSSIISEIKLLVDHCRLMRLRQQTGGVSAWHRPAQLRCLLTHWTSDVPDHHSPVQMCHSADASPLRCTGSVWENTHTHARTMWDIFLKSFNKCTFYLLRARTLEYTQLPLLTCVCGGTGAWRRNSYSASLHSLKGPGANFVTADRAEQFRISTSLQLTEGDRTHRETFAEDQLSLTWEHRPVRDGLLNSPWVGGELRELRTLFWTIELRGFESQTVSSFIDKCFHVICSNAKIY